MSGPAHQELGHAHGLFVQTAHLHHERPCSYFEVYEGAGPAVAARGAQLLMAWRHCGEQTSWEGRGHRRLAEKALQRLLADAGFVRLPLLWGVALLLVALVISSTFLSLRAPTVRVIDGDTISVNGETVRLWGVDAPERGQNCLTAEGEPYPCGRYATEALRAILAGGGRLDCKPRGRDRYGRTVAVCVRGGQDVGEALVVAGWAVDFTRYSHGRYFWAQAGAEARRAGIWAGAFTMPSDYRRRGQ